MNEKQLSTSQESSNFQGGLKAHCYYFQKAGKILQHTPSPIGNRLTAKRDFAGVGLFPGISFHFYKVLLTTRNPCKNTSGFSKVPATNKILKIGSELAMLRVQCKRKLFVNFFLSYIIEENGYHTTTKLSELRTKPQMW